MLTIAFLHLVLFFFILAVLVIYRPNGEAMRRYQKRQEDKKKYLFLND